MKRMALFAIVPAVLALAIWFNVQLASNPPQTGHVIDTSAGVLQEPVQKPAPLSTGVADLVAVHSLTRPLFSPTRRKWVEKIQAPPEPTIVPEPATPAPQPTPVAVEVETPPPQVSLIGIQRTPGKSQVLFQKSGSSETVWIEEGEKLEDWTLGLVEGAAVELVKGDKRVKLELYPLGAVQEVPQ
jgi:hypothetical protein